MTYLGLTCLTGCLLYAIIVLSNRFLIRNTPLEGKDPIWHPITGFTPLLLLSVILLEHFTYLRDIRGIVLFVSLAGSAYLHYRLWEKRIKKPSQESMEAQESGAVHQSRFDPKRSSVFVLMLSVCLYILYATGLIFPAHPITGDEPHYLLITKSLISDGDLNLSNNYGDRDYLQFYPGELDSHARPGKKGSGYEYSKHSPGLPILLVPSYFIGETLSGLASTPQQNPIRGHQILIFTLHVSMALIAALLCWVFFLSARDFTKNQNVALLSWFIFTMTSPLFFYSHLIYPEIPASLIMLAILYRVLFSKNTASSTHLWAGLGIAFLPWLGAKYIVLCAGLFGIVISHIWRSDRKRGNTILLFMTPLLLSAGFYLFYLWSLYGNVLPSSIYKGYLPSGPSLSLGIFHFKFSEFIRCGLSYLFDQSVGIFPYSPVYMIFLPGIVLSFLRKKRQTRPLLGMFLLYWSFCSMAYYWGGYCPPGRTLLPVVCILALFMAGALAWGKSPSAVSIHRVLLFLSLGIVFLCAKNPKLLYHEFLSLFVVVSEATSNLMNSLSNSVVNFRLLVPSFVNKYYITWTSFVFWMLGLSLICVPFLKRGKKMFDRTGRLGKPQIAVFLISLLLIAYTFFDIRIDEAIHFESKPYKLYFQDTNNFGQELSGFWTLGQKATEILIKTDNEVSNISVKLSSPVPGKTKVRVGRSRQSTSRNRTEGPEHTLRFPFPVGFPTRDGYLYSIRIQEAGGFYPFRLDPGNQDNRFLGVYVEIVIEPI